MGQKIQLNFGALSLVLSVPAFGDTDSNEQTRINRETRNGDLIIFHDPQWPVIEKLTYKLPYLSQIQCKQYLSFIHTSLGQNVTLIDHNNIGWVGIIVNPDAAVTQTGRNDIGCGGFETELQFEGSRI
jgi:hypothetical protein